MASIQAIFLRRGKLVVRHHDKALLSSTRTHVQVRKHSLAESRIGTTTSYTHQVSGFYINKFPQLREFKRVWFDKWRLHQQIALNFKGGSQRPRESPSSTVTNRQRLFGCNAPSPSFVAWDCRNADSFT
jgi:hypothetical protein